MTAHALSSAILNDVLSPTPESRTEALKSIFSHSDKHVDAMQRDPSPGDTHAPTPVLPFQTAIIGGGFAGILLALKLSKSPGASVVLVESAASLGGRLFFSHPVSLAGMRAWERFQTRFEDLKAGLHMSGFGAEILDMRALEIYERHILSMLSEVEHAFVDSFARYLAPEAVLSRRCYVVKKEFTGLGELASGTSEIFTRKEAESLSALFEQSTAENTDDASGQSTAALVAFEMSDFWKALGKGHKDALTPVLESIVGGDFLRAPSAAVNACLEEFFKGTSSREPITHGAAGALFMRGCGLELALELILRSRGVCVRTGCTVSKINEETSHHTLIVTDEVSPLRREIYAKDLCLAAPLSTATGFFPRSWYAPAQARLIAGKGRPRSLVALEFANARELPMESCPTEASLPGTRFVFPSERARGCITGQNTLVVYVYLDFENSLQAPSVREAITRLRKVAARIARPEALKAVAPGTRMPQPGLTHERIVLLPVGQTIMLESAGIDLRDVRMGRPGLFCCGDSFGFGYQPWKNVVDSVHEAGKLMEKRR